MGGDAIMLRGVARQGAPAATHVQQALVSAYKQHEEDSRLITAEMDTESGEPHVYHWLTVVEDIPDDVEDDSPSQSARPYSARMKATS